MTTIDELRQIPGASCSRAPCMMHEKGMTHSALASLFTGDAVGLGAGAEVGEPVGPEVGVGRRRAVRSLGQNGYGPQQLGTNSAGEPR